MTKEYKIMHVNEEVDRNVFFSLSHNSKLLSVDQRNWSAHKLRKDKGKYFFIQVTIYLENSPGCRTIEKLVLIPIWFSSFLKLSVQIRFWKKWFSKKI